MCTNCKVYNGCDCSGGGVFADCPAKWNVHCPICKHDGGTQLDAPLVGAPGLLAQMLRPEVLEAARQYEAARLAK